MKKMKLRLSIKILLMFVLILTAFWICIGIVAMVLKLAGISVSEPNPDNFSQWLTLAILLAVVTMGVCMVLVFTYAMDKTVVSRIKRLNSAINEVINGNYGVELAANGQDELSDLTRSFNKMAAELIANEYLSKEFVRNVSHEFKTPLSAIRAYGEMLVKSARNGNISPEKTNEYASIIIKESDRLNELSKSIIQISLLDSTSIIKKDDVFIPAEQIRSILQLMHTKGEEKNLSLNLNIEEITIKSNRLLVYQIWQNLISNAIKFSKQGGEISILLAKSENGIIFEISDNGIGIKESDKDKIFTQFFMSDESRNNEGSGLGLSVTKKILDKIDGTISFESTEGKGSKFTVQIFFNNIFTKDLAK